MILVSKYTAIKQLINSHLQEALSIYTSEKKILTFALEEIAARKSKEICKVLYISEIAFKLAKVYGTSASVIANQVVSHFCDCKENFMFKAVEGLIHIEVGDSVIAVFLQSLVEQHSFPTLPHSHTPRLRNSHTASFSIQYAHARCCSLLLIALHSGLISFERPLQISWLDSQGKLRFNSDESQRLIANLVEVVDDLVCVDRPDAYWHSKALNLSQALICFWRHTRIWSEVKVKPELVRTHIGLIVATQQILRLLLEEKLNSVAWFEM
ncbi:arginyl tRNA synthetase anticodon binding protein [Calothrix sp. NIES-4071]|nr:arginyl tRNA synthetase anticodon binding protein [Calothrix sp. NIES-4071]BAZ62005.1 arginyl tRNA synthetase anticodon binding protein [Calothrix sp. NIES-4105]